MPYYQGDFYNEREMGDFYQGDPGILSFFGGLAKRAVSAVPGLGTVVSSVGAIVRPGVGRVGPMARRVGGAIMKHPVISAAGAAGVIGAGGMAVEAMRGGVPGKGFHISKKTGRLVRNRRMRVTNPRALRRAIRRATGFARLARRVLHFTSPRAPRGRAIFKHRRAGARKLRA